LSKDICVDYITHAIVCCLQLNTGRGADANPKVNFLDIDACWIAVYVLCRNALIKSHSTHHDICMCIVMPSLFVNESGFGEQMGRCACLHCRWILSTTIGFPLSTHGDYTAL
jgi:hypothetical protein